MGFLDKLFPNKRNKIVKYDTLVLLVHPLYDLVYTKAGNKNLKAELAKKGNRLKLKKFLEIYGREMKQYIGKENVCFCLLTPSTGDNQNNIINERYLKDYNEVLSKFIAKGKEWLGDRFVISDYYTTHELFNQNAYKRFKRNIQIIGFGEYGEGCVKAATNVLIPDMLISHGITSKSIVLDEKSYF